MENKLKETLEIVQNLSLQDDLTGLYNRRGFITLAEQQLRLANRNQKSMAVVFADMDGLKSINDKLGHKQGDAAIIAMGNILTETFRKSDVVARLGGDEFAVLAIATSEADLLSEKILENVKAYNHKHRRKFTLSVSIGVVLYSPDNPCSIETLIDRADEKMYHNKMARNKRKLIPISPQRRRA
jgi:diguanylate cyclase (GGDEF)-like protein